MDISDFENKTPVLRLEDFFSGRLKGWGYTVGRFGGFQNAFKIDTQGHWDPTVRTLSMSEFYRFNDGHSDPLNWSILKKSDFEYEGRPFESVRACQVFEPPLFGGRFGRRVSS